MTEIKKLILEKETIKLGQLLKKAEITSSGGQAKQMLAEGKIKVNGETENRRGRKLEPGDLVEIEGQTRVACLPQTVMILTRLQLVDFRNYQQQEIVFHPGLNWIVGDNGEGKTNLLEAIYYLSALETFRSGSRDMDLIRWGEPGFFLHGALSENGREVSLDIACSTTGKQVKLNGKRPRRKNEITDLFPTVLFSPQDVAIAQGPPGVRRQWLDRLLKRSSPQYQQLHYRYFHALAQRNSLLRAIASGNGSPGDLEVWDNSLARLAAQIIKKRLVLLQQIGPACAVFHAEVSGSREKLSLSYQLPFQLEEGEEITPGFIYTQLKSRRQEELRLGCTLVGPHRDDIIFRINSKDIRFYGSQGQQRSAVLSLKLAELKVLEDQLGSLPTLLLDDVLSELDQKRQKQIFQAAEESAQVFITSTRIEQIPLRRTAAVFTVKAGQIERKEV